MKRFISLLVCLAFFICLIPVSTSADSATLAERVLGIIRPRIPSTTSYSDFASSISAENDRTVYHFNWSSGKDGEYKDMYVTALENGIITSFGLNEGSSSASQNPTSVFDRISSKEAQDKTKELLKVLNPDIANQLRLSPVSDKEQLDAQNHTFSITHTESGIPVYGDRGRVTVDINAERITSFSLNYTDNLSYPSPVKIIDLATAKSLFTEKIGLDLYYKVWQDNEKKSYKIFPVYSPKTNNYFINANTGEAEKIIPFSESFFVKNETMDTLPGGNTLGLTPAELKEIQNLKKLLTKSAAESLVRRIKPLGISQGYTLEEFTTRKLSPIEQLYGHSLVFCQTTEDRSSYIFVDINAETGEVLSFSNFTSENTENIDESIDLSSTCDSIIKELAPQKHTEYKLREEGSDKHFKTYDRYANGIRVDGNTISIELTPSGTLASYRISYTNANFPMYSDIISNAEASEKLFDLAGYSLLYIPQKSTESLKHPDKAVLIYDLDDYGIYLDPYTAKRINADGSEYMTENSSVEYIDIQGHYAEEKIKALHRFGIGFDSPEFTPDAPCLQKDFIILLTSAFGTKSGILAATDTNQDDYFDEAQKLGIINADEITPDLYISRLEAAKLICRVLGIEKYAQLDKIFACPFNDVSDAKGYVTLLWGIGIINGTSQNTFSPNDNLTRGQAAIMIYNAISNK